MLYFYTLEPSTRSPLYYIKLKILNYYGYHVDVRTNPSVIEDFVVSYGTIGKIDMETNSPKPFVLRIYDRRDGIPIPVDGKNYALITPKLSPEDVYDFTLYPGNARLIV